MNDQELELIYEGMTEVYGDDVPDPDVYPRCFQHLLKMYLAYHHKGFKDELEAN